MLKCLANRKMEFSRGPGKDDQAQTKIGFCELPNWVEEDPFFKAGLMDGSIKAFESTKDAEEIAKAHETLSDLKAEIERLQDKLETVKSNGDEKVQALKDEIAELESKKDSLKGNGGKNK